jgi:ribosomal protein S17
MFPSTVRAMTLGLFVPALTPSTDRYEKRHKNLAAHVSPAFRVELGDLVTVGMYSKMFS